ncbi:MAG: peptide-methionine (S)-S-oxide reductase MsrA [Nocardioidaceae bacterium]|nr:peptide-methionine (S)-S-oxide reductase MsrA [Nocardioidaceae bacterium]
MMFGRKKTTLVEPQDALPGRDTRPFEVGTDNLVLGTPMEAAVPDGFQEVVVGLGCFWGEEKTFWEAPGVWTTAVGYAGGVTPNPTYDEVCTGMTGHAEVVRVVFDPKVLPFEQVLRIFWENHDPTQGMRQGNDVGTQYRSVMYTTTPEQQELAEKSREVYQRDMTARGYGEITTAILPLEHFWYAESVHQQYLAKNPFGYCPLHATGVAYSG